MSGPTGHHRHGIVDSMEVNNAIYSEPTPLDRVAPRGGGGTGGEDPPLPPRPLSGSAQPDDSSQPEAFYQAPVDTLGRGCGMDQQQRSSSTKDKERAQQKERDRKRMDWHERTLNQLQGAAGGGGLGHRRTRSGGHLIDNAEYSTPWNVKEEQRRLSGQPQKPPRGKKPGVGKPIPATPNDGSDNIIPVSPNAILSSPHDRAQSASPVPPRSPLPSSTEPEYDDPWDVKNRNINQVIPSQHGRHHGHSLHDRRSPPLSQLASEHRPMRQSAGARVEHSRHLEEVRPMRASSEKNRTGILEGNESFRPRTTTDIHGHALNVSAPNSPRTNSLSMPAPSHAMQRRPLPEEPSNTTNLPSPSSIPMRREPSPSSTWFDTQLALEEQP